MDRFIILSLILCILCACNDDIVVIPTESSIQVTRFDKSISADSIQELRDKFPAFTKIYLENILNISKIEEGGGANELNLFMQDEFIAALNHKVDSVYLDLDNVERQLSYSLGLFKEKLDPDFNPSIYTFISGLVYQTILFEDDGKDGIGLGLDMFLGKNFPYKSLATQNPAFSDYIVRAFNEDHISKKVLENLVLDQMGEVKGNRLLDYMIYNGKKNYILEQLLPYAKDSVIIEYSDQQIKWCQDNQKDIWSHFFREELFYETDMRKINKLILPSPNSPGMPDIAPGRTANYIGWQIVRQYMKRYPKTKLTELIAMNDNQSILDKSKYKPR